MHFFNQQIIAQLVGFFATFAIVVSMQQKKYSQLALWKITNSFLCTIHYFLLGGFTGMALELVSAVTNTVYYYRIKNQKSTLVFQIIFSFLFAVLGIVTWCGPISIFAISAKIVSTISVGINNPKTIRILNLICNPCWLIYDIYVFSISGIITETLVIISVIIAMFRLDFAKAGKDV